MSAQKESVLLAYFKSLGEMRWNLLWFAPAACFLVLLAMFDFLEGLGYLTVLLKVPHPFAAVLSPSAYFWVSSTFASVGIPLQPLFAVPVIFGPGGERFRRKTRAALLYLFAALAITFITWILIWGSFPFDNEADGIHLRMLPFIPWPSRSL